MAFATYWVHVFSPISGKLKNGVHLVEAEEWEGTPQRKGWWRVRIPGSQRSVYVSPRVWGANRAIPYTGQPFGLAMLELHKLKEKENGKTSSAASCPVQPVQAGQGSGEAASSPQSRPDRVRRSRAVRKARR